MENPPKEIADVVRSITEPYDSKVILRNVENYFTQDARLEHPLMNQPYDSQNGREDLKGIYKMLRVTTLNNKIVFHAIMFNEDFTKATLELTMHIQFRHLPLKSQARYLVRLDLRKEADNKYRIYRSVIATCIFRLALQFAGHTEPQSLELTVKFYPPLAHLGRKYSSIFPVPTNTECLNELASKTTSQQTLQTLRRPSHQV